MTIRNRAKVDTICIVLKSGTLRGWIVRWRRYVTSKSGQYLYGIRTRHFTGWIVRWRRYITGKSGQYVYAIRALHRVEVGCEIPHWLERETKQTSLYWPLTGKPEEKNPKTFRESLKRIVSEWVPVSLCNSKRRTWSWRRYVTEPKRTISAWY